jgi:hypothetical protein
MRAMMGLSHHNHNSKGGCQMADYKEMYAKLFRSQTKAIHILQEAQQQTEDMFIEAEPTNLRLLKREEDKTDD